MTERDEEFGWRVPDYHKPSDPGMTGSIGEQVLEVLGAVAILLAAGAFWTLLVSCASMFGRV